MSAKSKGTSSPTEGPSSKAKVKEQIKNIVDDLELVLGDLKDVAKELKEVRQSGAMGAESIMLGSAKQGEEYRCSKNSHLTIKHKQLPPVLPVLSRHELVNISCLCPG